MTVKFDIDSLAYRAFHDAVVHHVRKVLRRDWTPRNPDEDAQIEANVRFFDEQCTYDEEFLEGLEPDEVAENNVEAAIAMQ